MGCFILGKNESESSHRVSGPCSNERKAEAGWPLFLKSHNILTAFVTVDWSKQVTRQPIFKGWGSTLCLLVEEAEMWNHDGLQTQGAWPTGGHYFNNLHHQLSDSLMQCLLKG